MASSQLKMIAPTKFLSVCKERLEQTHPIDNQSTRRLLDRINVLCQRLENVQPKDLRDGGADTIAAYKTQLYLRNANTMTAVEHYRTKAGLTQEQLANLVGISSRQLQKYESASSALGDAKFAAVERIADALHCKASDLVKNGLAVRLQKPVSSRSMSDRLTAAEDLSHKQQQTSAKRPLPEREDR